MSRFASPVAATAWLLAGALSPVAPAARADAPATQEERTRDHRMAGLVFEAPAAAEVTERALETGPQVVALTVGDEVLLLTIYRGETAPSDKKALTVHLDEVERALQGEAQTRTTPLWRRLLGRRSKGWEVAYRRGDVEWVARLLARRRGGLTVVAAWTSPRSALRTSFVPATLASLAVE